MYREIPCSSSILQLSFTLLLSSILVRHVFIFVMRVAMSILMKDELGNINVSSFGLENVRQNGSPLKDNFYFFHRRGFAGPSNKMTRLVLTMDKILHTCTPVFSLLQNMSVNSIKNICFISFVEDEKVKHTT